MKPYVGRIVLYTMNSADCYRLQSLRDRLVAAGWVGIEGYLPFPGTVLPMIVTHVEDFPSRRLTVNGQVFNDGSDTLYVWSVPEGDPGVQGTWSGLEKP